MDRLAQILDELLADSETARLATIRSGGRAGTTVTVRDQNNRPVTAYCAVSVPPGPCLLMLANRGWIVVPQQADRIVGQRNLAFRQYRRDGVKEQLYGMWYIVNFAEGEPLQFGSPEHLLGIGTGIFNVEADSLFALNGALLGDTVGTRIIDPLEPTYWMPFRKRSEAFFYVATPSERFYPRAWAYLFDPGVDFRVVLGAIDGIIPPIGFGFQEIISIEIFWVNIP